MSCDIVIPVYNQLDYTSGCLESIKKNTEYSHRIIVIDDASSQETKEYLENLEKNRKIILCRNEKNLGWLDSVNKGIMSAFAEYVCVMNNDTIVYSGWLEEMVSVAQKNPVFGLVNPEWQIPKKFKGGRENYYHEVIKKQSGKFIETDWVRGFCFLIKRAVIEKIGGLDKVFAPGYYDDWDYSLRAIQEGFLVVKAQGAFVWHYKNVTYEQVFGKKEMEQEFYEKKKIFHNRWGRFNKVLLIVDSSLESKNGNLEELSLGLLRKQTRLVVIKGKFDFYLRHTNCLIIPILDFFLKARVLAHLWRNSLLKPAKRYDYVLCSQRIKVFLDKSWFMPVGFNIKLL